MFGSVPLSCCPLTKPNQAGSAHSVMRSFAMAHAPAQRSAPDVALHPVSDEQRHRALSAVGCVRRPGICDLARCHDAYLVSAYRTTRSRMTARREAL